MSTHIRITDRKFKRDKIFGQVLEVIIKFCDDLIIMNFASNIRTDVSAVLIITYSCHHI